MFLTPFFYQRCPSQRKTHKTKDQPLGCSSQSHRGNWKLHRRERKQAPNLTNQSVTHLAGRLRRVARPSVFTSHALVHAEPKCTVRAWNTLACSLWLACSELTQQLWPCTCQPHSSTYLSFLHASHASGGRRRGRGAFRRRGKSDYNLCSGMKDSGSSSCFLTFSGITFVCLTVTVPHTHTHTRGSCDREGVASSQESASSSSDRCRKRNEPFLCSTGRSEDVCRPIQLHFHGIVGRFLTDQSTKGDAALPGFHVRRRTRVEERAW